MANDNSLGPDLDYNFDDFFHEWFPWLYQRARREGLDHGHAEDVAQEAMVALFANAKKRNIYNVRGYLFGTLKRLIADKFRRKKGYRTEPISQDLEDRTDSDSKCREIIVEAKSIAPTQRIADGCTYLEDRLDGNTVSEIADKHDLPTGTVKTRMMAAREFIQSMSGSLL